MYLDTSIIVKLLVSEADSLFFEEHLSGKSLSTSELARTEVFSALLAKERDRRISPKNRQAAWESFNHWVQSEQIKLHSLDSIALLKASQLLERCHPKVPLRSLDAIHMAACDLSQDFPLCTNDKRMREAAGILHIPVFPE